MANNIGSKLDALRNKRREEEEEEQKKAASVGASLDALRNKRQTEEAAKTVDVSAWNNVLSDSGTKEKIKASREFAEQALQNTPTKQKETKDALAIRNQEAKVDKLAREEEAKRKAYNDLPLVDRVMNVSADEYSSDEARQKKAAEVELDRMRLTPEEFEKQHKADLGESLYQIAHAGATGVAGSFARAADVGVALVEGAKQAGRWIAGEGDEKSSVAREFTKGYQRSLVEDSLYDEVYDQYEREYQRNREIDGEVNALTKYTAQAAQSVGEQAVMLWTASLGGALWTGSKAATTVAKVSDDLMNSGKKAVRLLGRALGKFDAGALSGPASMLVTTSASSTAEAIKAMRAKNEQRISNGLEAEYSENDIARKAALYGVLNGLSETSLEYALGGVTGAAKGILPTGKVKNPILTATLSYLKGAAGEGVEEMVQTLASTGLQNLTYNAEATVNWTEVLESGIVGAISGLGMSAPSFVQNTRLGVSAMHDVSDTVKAADKADSDVAQGIVALAASSKAAAYAETAQAMRDTGSENAETLASIYDWASEQQAKIAKSLTGEETGAQIKEKAAANKNEAPSPAPTEAESLVPPDATQTEAQVITTDVQNKVRREAVQRENVSAENGGATVVSELTQKIKNVAPKANIQTVQKLVDAVHMVQTGTMPDKSYNEALNLLRDERVLRTVAAEVGGDFAVDTKNKATIRASLEAVAKRYAETAEQADMDSLSEEISHAVATLPAYQSPARSASDAITVEGGQITRAEFVRNYGAALAQQGRAADDVFDNLLAAEQTPNADVNAPIQTAEMPTMMSAAPNADVNAINREVNTFEHEANAPIQTAEQGTPVPNADVNAFNREVNTFEHEANAPIQTAENDVSRETISPNATERGVHRLFSEKTPLTEIQRESIQALEMLSRAVNVDIYLYDSAVDSEYGYSSGRYDTGTDRVYVDINAGAHYEGTILRTAGHELTHYLKRWSPEGFEDLSAFVEMTLTESGADIAALMEGKKANALKHGNELSDDIAYEEVIADACQMLLTDSDALYRLSEQNKTLFERVMDFFREFLDNLRSVYAGYKPTTEAGRIMAAQTQDVMDMLSEVYSDALIRAGKARTEAQKMISGEQSIFADAKTEQGSDLFDYRAMQADMGRYEQMLTKWGGMSKPDVSRLMAMIGHTVDVVSENAQKLDYGYDTDPKAERPFNPVKKNSDDLYQISIDYSTLCRKRIVQSIVAQNLEAALERPLSKEEAIQIREALIEVQKDAKTVEVACALCYVEAARLKTPEQVTKVLQNLPTVLHRHYAAKNGNSKKAVADAEKAAKVDLGLPENKTLKSIKDEDVAARKLTANEAKAIIRDAKKAALDGFALTAAQKAEIEYAQTLPVTAFTTAKGLSELAQKHHDVYKAYADAVRSASRSKGLEADVPWRAGDADSISDNLITSMNEGAGVRSQSWSDFQAIHLLDELAMTIEMATRGAKMHSYTKVPDYVRLLGLTGHMINMSLIPTRDGNGFDGVEGMPYEIMLLLRDQYPDTAGNICIGVNDEQILRLLDSDEIDYVIPYHHSGNSIATRRALNIPEWTSYQDIQSEKGGDGPAFAEWFDINRARETAARENASPTDPAAKEKYGVQYGAYKAMQEAADRYLQICAERGLTPKFKGKVEGGNVDFTTHPNYWKLLIDRKMVNQITGEIIEQKPVQPIFDPAVIYGDPADGNVGGILGRALEYYDAHQADTAYAVETVTRAMAENKDSEIGQELSGKQKILDKIIGDSVKAIQDGGVLFEYRETDETYLKAVEAGDTEKEAQIIEATALANGYTEEVLHGTQKFGFTKLDTKFSDDGMSFFYPERQLKSADPITYDDNGSVIPPSERFNPKNKDVRFELRVSPESAPNASQRDLASSPEFEAFVKAYDAVHGEGAARTIVRTTEQFDRERARQRKREATAAQMARLPETEAKLRRMAEAAERSRKDESKINAIKNPAVRRAKLSAHLAKQEAEAIRRVAEIDAQMRVADQAYRDNIEMQDRLAEQQARAEERLRGVKADYQERLDRERVRTAQAKFEGKQNASERVQRERYKQWWQNRIHEEEMDAARQESRKRVHDAREEERARAAERAKEVRDYRAFRNRNADVISEQRQNRHNTYPTGEGAIGNMIDRKQEAYNERAARDQADFEREYQLGQASAASRTGAAYVPGAPDTEIKPYLSTADTSATPPGNTFKPVPSKTGKVVEAVKGLPEKAQHTASEVYRLLVNSAQPLDDIAKKQEKAGFLATASDYVTSARNAPAVASYIISEGLTDKSGNPLGKSLADVVLVHGADDVTFGGETVKAQQAFQDYLLHKHNVDRMSFTVRAKQDLDALIEENPWIPDFVDETTSEFTRELYGLSEEQREIVARWADLNRRFREAKDKPIFPAENDTVWTAEQSQARVELYEREQPWMKDKAEDLYQWWDTFMREYAVGVSITTEEYEAMRTLYPHYVPTYREGKSIGKSTNAVAGSVSAGKAVHEAKGGTSEVRWIQDTLAEQVTKIVGLQKQNELLLNLVDSAMLDSDGTMFPGLRVTPKSMGYSTLMTAEDLDNADHQMQTLSKNPDGTYTVTAWDNGNRVSVYVSEDVYNALFSMFGQKSKGYQLALTAGRKLSTPMKSMITGYNPAFGVRNVVRDVATGLIQAEGGTLSGMGSYAANYVRAWNQIASGSDAWNAFKAQGGAGSTHYRAEDGLSSHAEKMMTPGWAGRVKGALGWFNETSESAARFAAYLQYLKAHGDTPENRIRAIHSAAEITTDFSRSGDIGRLLNAWVPYSNAATQGVDRVLRDFTQGKAVNRLTRAAIVQGIPAAIIGLVVKGLGREDEYDEISDYHKDNYYLIPIPDGKWIRLPKTPFYGTLLTSGVSRAVEGVLGREDPFDGFGATAAEAFNLPGAGAETLPEAASSVVRDVVGIGPMLDLHMNKNFIGQDIVPSEFKDYSSGKFAPNNTQYNDETSAVAMVLSKMMLSAVSPIQMDYLMKSYMGDFYHGIASIVDVGLLRSFTAEDLGKNLFDATLGETGSSFVVDPAYSNRYTGEYYDMLDAMAAQIAADKVHLPEGDHKNTLTYHTKQAIENKYGKDISAAYKTARSAVGEAQKRDAREEAVRLSIEALDFYEQAMAGKYGSDPSRHVEYEQYGEDVCEALLQLTPYEEKFRFEPDDSYAPDSLTVDKVKYELTAEQRDDYKALYVRTYSALARQVISSQEYRLAGARRRAELLEDVASNAREQTRENYKMILSGK